MDKKNQKIKNSNLFGRNSRAFGLPVPVFVFIAGMSIITSISLFMYLPLFLSIPFSIIFCFVSYLPAYIIHVDDPVGYRTWLAVLSSPESFHCESFKKREVKIVNLDNKHVEYSTLTNFFHLQSKRNK